MSATPPEAPPSLPATRRIAFRVAAATLLPLLLLLTAEGLLRLSGYGYPTSFFIRQPDQKA